VKIRGVVTTATDMRDRRLVTSGRIESASTPESQPLPEPAPEVAIAIVSWNTCELLRSCLQSIAPEVDAGRIETWVVDNGSSDGSDELVRSQFRWAKLVASAENLGFGAAVNLVARQTQTPWLAMANADTELTQGALLRLLQAGEHDPRAGVIAPRLLLPDGTSQHSVYGFPTLPFALAFNLGFGSISPLGDRLALPARWNPMRDRVVDWAVGAFLLVRRTAWEAIGGFDPWQWMYAEDLDLGWRMAAAGWRTRYEPGAVVRHHGEAATTKMWGPDRDIRWQRSTYAWMVRRRGIVRTRLFALINTVGAATRMSLVAPLALLAGGARRERLRALRRWTKLHFENLTARREVLEGHR
jgi:N-acetylglucosaminyl-diphospho-decaprenol L-rhamnosyltransferase